MLEEQGRRGSSGSSRRSAWNHGAHRRRRLPGRSRALRRRHRRGLAPVFVRCAVHAEPGEMRLSVGERGELRAWMRRRRGSAGDPEGAGPVAAVRVVAEPADLRSAARGRCDRSGGANAVSLRGRAVSLRSRRRPWMRAVSASRRDLYARLRRCRRDDRRAAGVAARRRGSPLPSSAARPRSLTDPRPRTRVAVVAA